LESNGNFSVARFNEVVVRNTYRANKHLSDVRVAIFLVLMEKPEISTILTVFAECI
jgi:hypothetical protein